MLEVDRLFHSGAVLQCDAPVKITGRSLPGVQIAGHLGSEEAYALSDSLGAWTLHFGPRPASTECSLVVRASPDHIFTADGLLFGDVWLCAGQSNMEYPAELSGIGPEALATITRENIRVFTVPVTGSSIELDAIEGAWTAVSPEVAPRLSGFAISFAAEIARTRRIPVGVIVTARGGSEAEAWMPRAALQKSPEGREALARPHLPGDMNDPEVQQALQVWRETYFHRDAENLGEPREWHRSDFDDSSWDEVPFPAHMDDYGKPNPGARWFRREVGISGFESPEDLFLRLGSTKDCPPPYLTVYWNGTVLAHRTQETEFVVPAAYVHEGLNSIAIRVFHNCMPASIFTPPLDLRATSDTQTTDLSGLWKFRDESLLPKLTIAPHPHFKDDPGAPSHLYNGMIAPLSGVSLRGVVWYQGESNAPRARAYRTLLRDLIMGWRDHLGSDLPFIVVQLPAYRRRGYSGNPIWAELRESQEFVVRSLPAVWLSLSLDSGDELLIHPTNKQFLSYRAACVARRHIYQETLVPSDGPQFKGFDVEDGAVRIQLKHGSGLVTFGGEPVRGFSLAGASGEFYTASATISGEEIVVTSPEVPHPVHVRYGWANNPGGNVMNHQGLPLNAFRTDN